MIQKERICNSGRHWYFLLNGRPKENKTEWQLHMLHAMILPFSSFLSHLRQLPTTHSKQFRDSCLIIVFLFCSMKYSFQTDFLHLLKPNLEISIQLHKTFNNMKISHFWFFICYFSIFVSQSTKNLLAIRN